MKSDDIAGKPFAGFQDFDDCVRQNQDKGNPEAYCASIQQAAEKGGDVEEMLLSGPIVMKDTSRQIVTAPVLVPGEKDADGEEVTVEKIEEVALKFLEDSGLVDIGHTFNPVAVPVENWLLRNAQDFDMPDGQVLHAPKGTWMMSAKIKSSNVWSKVLKGVYKGFSVTGVRKADVLNALKTLKADSTEDQAFKHIMDMALKRKTLLADLGIDWVAMTVSIVEDPAVFKSKWIAIKEKAKTGGSWLASLLERFGLKEKTQEQEEVEMEKDEITKLVDEVVKTAVKEQLGEALKPLGELTEAVKGIGGKVEAMETAAKEATSKGEEDDKNKDKDKDKGDEEKKGDEPSMKEVMEKLEGFEKKIAPKSRALSGQEGEDDDKDTAVKGHSDDRDTYGRKVNRPTA